MVLAVGATAVAILCGEALLRLIRPNAMLPYTMQIYRDAEKGKFYQHHPMLGWSGKPDVEGTFSAPDCRHSVRHNAHGFRGTFHPFERTDRSRIVVLGDSFVWGFGVASEQIFTHLVEVDRQPPTEVVNLGISGYGTDQSVINWQLIGRRFKPDHVVLVITPNTDLVENVSTQQHQLPKPMIVFDAQGNAQPVNVPVPRTSRDRWSATISTDNDPNVHALARLGARSALVAAALNTGASIDGPRQWLIERHIVPGRATGYRGEAIFHVSPIPPGAETNWRVLLSLVGLCQQQVNAAGAAFSVLVVPSVLQVYDDAWFDFQQHFQLPAESQWDRDALSRNLIEYCRERQIHLIDPRPALAKAAVTDPHLYYGWNHHWTPTGHRIVADVLMREID